MATERTAWTPIAATGEVIDQADIRSIPGGLIAEIRLATTTLTGITSDQTPITGWTGDVALVSGRRYKVTTCGHVAATSTGGNFGIDTMDDGTRIQFARGHAEAGSSQFMTVMSVCFIDGDDSTHTIRADFDVIDAGTYSIASNTGTNPCVILVEDVGPSTGFA